MTGEPHGGEDDPSPRWTEPVAAAVVALLVLTSAVGVVAGSSAGPAPASTTGVDVDHTLGSVDGGGETPTAPARATSRGSVAVRTGPDARARTAGVRPVTAVGARSPAATSAENVTLVVRFESFSARESTTASDLGVTVTGGRDVEFMPVLFASAPRSAIPALAARPGVADVTVDHPIRAPPSNRTRETEPASPGGEAGVGQIVPWGVDRIGARAAVDRVPDDAERNVTVAVLDTGIDYRHPDLDDTVVWGANFSEGVSRDGLSTADDNYGHGTQVAGILAAEDNDRGVVGVAPNATLYSIKVLNRNNFGYYTWWIRGMDAAIAGPDDEIGTDDDADVISMSLGGDSDSSALEDGVERASEHAVVVAAAMNSGDGDPTTNEVHYPARYDEAIAVAATDRSDATARFSSEGEEVELAAPGVGVETTVRSGGTGTFSGTSAATPHVSGVVALQIAADLADGSRDATSSQLRERLQTTARDIETPGRDRLSGYGLIQAEAAVDANDPPAADAGDDRTVASGATVELNASGSRDPDGDALAYDWAQTGGPPVALSGEESATATFTAPAVSTTTTLTFEVTVDDGSTTDTDAVTVTVAPPVTLAAGSATAEPGENATVPITLSSAPGGLVAARVTVRVANPGVARPVGVRAGDLSPDQTTVDSLTNDTITVSAGDLAGDRVGPTDDEVVLAEIVLAARATGETDVEVEAERILDDSRAEVATTPRFGRLVVGTDPNPFPDGLPGLRGAAAPTDPDGDGLFEDVGGDGEVTFVDVIDLLFAMNRLEASSLSARQTATLDFDANGRVGFPDVIALLFEV